MDKLTIAHEYAMKHLEFLEEDCPEVLAIKAWQYADAMQAEADKREVSIEEMMKDHVHDYIYGRVCACGAVNGAEKEWQPDWSVAPEWANYWIKTSGDLFAWLERKPRISNLIGGWNIECIKKQIAQSFNYQGNWQDSLRKRPQ